MNIKKILLVLSFPLVLIFSNTLPAADSQNYGPGSFADNLFGDVLKDHDLALVGWVNSVAIINDDDTDSVLPNGALSSDEGIHLNQFALMFCRGDGCLPTTKFSPKHNLLSRITPTPAPKSENIDIGFNLLAVYGADSQFLRISGFDDYTFDDDHEEKLSFPQWYLDIYLPYFDGMTVMVGSFMSQLAREIGYPYAPPSWFATISYELFYAPIKHVGALVSVKIPTDKDFGILSVEGGLTLGWNNLDNRNGDLAYMAGLRYRTPDMGTGFDIELMYGNGEDDFGEGPAKGGSQFFALSSTGETLNRFSGYATFLHRFNPKLESVFVGYYGFQEGGDLKPAPQFITEKAKWYGLYAAARYQIREDLYFNTRAEWTKDQKAAHLLWSGSPGSTYGLTANVDWQLNKYINLRPEVRYDYHDGNGLPLFGHKTENNQLLGLLNLTFKF